MLVLPMLTAEDYHGALNSEADRPGIVVGGALLPDGPHLRRHDIGWCKNNGASCAWNYCARSHGLDGREEECYGYRVPSPCLWLYRLCLWLPLGPLIRVLGILRC